jgi:nitrous oxidase accessory protein
MKNREVMSGWDKENFILMMNLIALLAFSTSISSAATISVTHGGSIQAAVDVAIPGDTIKVMNGTYKESVNVNKRLVLSGIGMPTVDANNNMSAIILSGGNCTIEGFNVINSRNSGITIQSDLNTISNNTLIDNGVGIYLKKSRNNMITHNDIRAGGWWNSGLSLKSSEYNIIKSNDVSYDGIWGTGISLVDSNYNNLTYNRASADGWLDGKGIFLRNSNSNLISSNDVRGRGWDGSGIHLDSSKNNIIRNNNACCSIEGIYLRASHNNAIENNIVEDIRLGVFIYLGKDNIIKNNNANIQLVDSDQNDVIDNAGWVYYGTVTGP